MHSSFPMLSEAKFEVCGKELVWKDFSCRAACIEIYSHRAAAERY